MKSVININSLLPYFLIGGIVFSFIHITINIYNDTALSAGIILFPLSLFGAYAVADRDNLSNYLYSLIRVLLITLLCLIMALLFLKINVNSYIIISMAIGLWFILQYYNYFDM